VPQPSIAQQPEADRNAALFQKLDANQDGKIVADEAPEEQRTLLGRLLRRGDKDQDGALTREEFAAALQDPLRRPADEPRRPEPGPGGRPGFRPMAGASSAILAALDADRDGELSADEIAKASESLKKLDRNGDGNITPRELAPPVQGVPGQRPRPEADRAEREAMLARLKMQDANGDGKLSRDEITAGRLKDNFEQVDRNSDGFIDEQEMNQVIEIMRRRQQQ
jgi:Ca2+-binding EF-hand superfamily protein